MNNNYTDDIETKAPKTAAERKAAEVKRRAAIGFRRRSYWLTDRSIAIVEKYKRLKGYENNDDALNEIIYLHIFRREDR